RDIGERLDAIAAACSDCVMHLDDVDRARGYYTGLRFRAYDASSRAVVAQGGRYDTLYEKFGAAAPAVGFTITCE
ncbi:MAG: ATP phosphoribosyltransferase regulatory subunit, partial [Acidobacteria bacterium]|nr:ATP phosphoribosyltransferase regulatory subunit [Acidobacteriota bacterium]